MLTHDHPARSGLRQFHHHRQRAARTHGDQRKSRDKPLERRGRHGEAAVRRRRRLSATTARSTCARSIVDPRTGTVQIRAVFPNAEDGLLPGQFVRVSIIGITMPNAIVVPKAAIVAGAAGRVRLCASMPTTWRRPVRSSSTARSRTAGSSQSGLKAGDRIVVDGVIRVRPGVTVKPVAASPAPAAPRGAPAATRREPPSRDLEILHRPAGLRLASCRSSSCSPAWWPCARCRSRSIRRSCRPRWW